MKKTLSLILALTFVFSVFSISASAKMPSPDVLNGYENVCLTYTFNTTRNDYGRHTVDDLKPYVGYYDAEGNLKDFFFDSYLFLPCVMNGPSGALMHTGGGEAPTLAIDWTTYVSDTFTRDYNVDALEVAFGNVKEELGAPDKKAGVFLTILYPNKRATNFGTLGGRNLNFSKMEDRKYAIKWIIDEQLKLYQERGYKNLDLVGFYWLEEYLLYDEDIQLFKYASDYLHSLGLKFIWIPWHMADGYERWSELGFDAACMQPNLYWLDTPDADRVKISCELSDKYGMSMEMELDARAISTKEYFDRYLIYLEDGMKSGAMNSIKMYYQASVPGIYYQACYTDYKYARDVYDLTYKYATATLTQEDIDKYRDPKVTMELPDGVDWISKGKTYKATKSFGAGGTAEGYQDFSGTELTDGVLASSNLGTEWHAFHKNNADKDGRMSVIIDLGEVHYDITYFAGQFGNYTKYGVGTPESVQIHYSVDGKEFKMASMPKLQSDGTYTYFVTEKTKSVEARYIKLSFRNNEHYNFVMCSEFLVGVKDNSVDESVNSESQAEQSNVSKDQDSQNNNNTKTIIIWCSVAVVVIIIGIAAILLVRKSRSNKE